MCILHVHSDLFHFCSCRQTQGAFCEEAAPARLAAAEAVAVNGYEDRSCTEYTRACSGKPSARPTFDTKKVIKDLFVNRDDEHFLVFNIETQAVS